MTVYEPKEKGVEVNGRTVLTVVKGLEDIEKEFRDKALKILAENGIEDPEPGEWYPQKAWLEAFRAINEELDETALWNIGKQIPHNAKWPDDVTTPEEGLNSIDKAYHMNHRKGEIGNYAFEKTGEGEGKMVCDNPYPCKFDKGICMGIVEKFGDYTTFLSIDEDEDYCRMDGDEKDVYQLSW